MKEVTKEILEAVNKKMGEIKETGDKTLNDDQIILLISNVISGRLNALMARRIDQIISEKLDDLVQEQIHSIFEEENSINLVKMKIRHALQDIHSTLLFRDKLKEKMFEKDIEFCMQEELKNIYIKVLYDDTK